MQWVDAVGGVEIHYGANRRTGSECVTPINDYQIAKKSRPALRSNPSSLREEVLGFLCFRFVLGLAPDIDDCDRPEGHEVDAGE